MRSWWALPDMAMLESSLCQQVSPTRVWALGSSGLLFVLSRPLLVAIALFTLYFLLWTFGRRRWRKPIAWISGLLLVAYLFIISPVFTRLGTHFLTRSLPPDTGETVDAIVVLGRGQEQNSIRAKVVGELWESKRAPLIFPSGRKDALIVADLIHDEFPEGEVAGEPCSLTTDQNAEFTAALLRPQGVKKIILVTDAPHMWRSLLTFESFGFEVIPHFTPLSEDTVPTKKRFLVMREIIGFINYKIMGRYNAREVPPPSVINEEEPASEFFGAYFLSPMFDHLSVGVTDLDKCLTFYDAALKPLGVSRMFAMSDRGIAAYVGTDQVSFWLYSKDAEQVGLGELPSPPRFHLAFRAGDRATVDAFYTAALENGGIDEGAPGIRAQYHPNYYAAYVRDPNGYKIEAVCQK